MELLKISKRELTRYNFEVFECQICGTEYQRNFKSKIYLKTKKIALGREICCPCGDTIKLNRVLEQLNFLKREIKGSIESYYGNNVVISLYDTLNKSVIINDIYYFSKQIHNFRTFFKI